LPRPRVMGGKNQKKSLSMSHKGGKIYCHCDWSGENCILYRAGKGGEQKTGVVPEKKKPVVLRRKGEKLGPAWKKEKERRNTQVCRGQRNVLWPREVSMFGRPWGENNWVPPHKPQRTLKTIASTPH